MALDTQNPESNVATTHAQGSEEAAIAAFEQRGKATSEPPKTEDEPIPENEDESTQDADESEADKADPDDPDDPDSALVEVEIEGETLEVSPKVQKAIKEGLLRQSEFSRKMNEVGDSERTAKARIEQADKLIEGAEKFASVLAEVKSLDAQIARFEKVDWANLRTNNPAEYAATRADLQAFIGERNQAQAEAQKIDGELSKSRDNANAVKRDEMLKELQKNLKGWGDELGGQITKYALDQGYTADDLRGVSDAKWVIAMDKARRYDALQKDKAGLKAKAQDAPKVVRPGAPRRADPAADAQARFSKSKSPDDAVALFLAREKGRSK